MSLGVSIQYSFWMSLVLLLVCVIIFSIILIKLKLKTIYKVAIISIVTISTFGLNLLNNPYYPEDFENRPIIPQYSSEDLQKLNVISNKKIKCFFLSDCPYCEIAAEKLNILYNAGKLKEIEIIYFAYPKTADSIVKAQSLSLPYTNFEDKSIFQLINNNFPAILLQNGDSTLLWSGNDVNFACFDYLTSLK